MKSTAVVPEPGPGVDALIKEARRWQRRRYAATGIAAVAVAAAALGAFAGLHEPAGRGGRARPGPTRRPGTPPASRYPAPSPAASTRPC